MRLHYVSQQRKEARQANKTAEELNVGNIAQQITIRAPLGNPNIYNLKNQET